MYLDLTVFQKALNSLKSAIIKYNQNINDDMIRDSVIQRFEYTYGLSIKMIERFLQTTSTVDVDILSFNQLIREANEREVLLGNLENWAEYRKKRNITSHTYDEAKALEVISIVEDFAKEAEFLLNKLKEKNED